MQEFRKSVTKTGEEIAFVLFPQKVHRYTQLSELLDTTSNPDSPFHLSHASSFTDVNVYPCTQPALDEPSQKKRKLNDTSDSDEEASRPNTSTMNDFQYARLSGQVRANHHIVKLHEIVKKECDQLIGLIDKVKLWVTLTMPNGDNFGVQIQEEVLSELHRAQESGYNLRDAARQDYLARAKIASKLIKYPNVEDYALSLREHDGKQLYLARQNMTDIRNMYAVLTDLIHKNITKIRAPKANNSVGLY
ncbi:proteasome activator pa28 REG alpha beta subunit [Amanita rubescens]|nr:proteasome activator pa28 REG alpha beta subunit [Amanita rubescens]